MREIKFRAWESDNQSMHFSYEYEDGFVWEIQPEIQLLELRMIDYMPGGEYHEQKEEWVAPNQTIMQYTGLKDKNGKEIYEGDIVEEATHTLEKNGLYKIGDKIGKNGIVFNIEKDDREGWKEIHKDRRFYHYWTGKLQEVVFDTEKGFLPMQDNDWEFGYGVSPENLRVVGNIYENPELLNSN